MTEGRLSQCCQTGHFTKAKAVICHTSRFSEPTGLLSIFKYAWMDKIHYVLIKNAICLH